MQKAFKNDAMQSLNPHSAEYLKARLPTCDLGSDR